MKGNKGAIGAAGGAVGLGTLSAAVGACCSVPWATALLGVTGAVALARLAFLMPYALAGSILLLAGAFWLAYRHPIGGTCGIGSRRSLRWLIWITAFFVASLTVLALNPRVGS